MRWTVITNCDTFLITIYDKVYYKLRQVLQSAIIITNCDSTKEVCTLEMSCPWIKSRAKKDEEKTLKYGPTMWELKQIQWLQSWTAQCNNWRTGCTWLLQTAREVGEEATRSESTGRTWVDAEVGHLRHFWHDLPITIEKKPFFANHGLKLVWRMSKTSLSSLDKASRFISFDNFVRKEILT